MARKSAVRHGPETAAYPGAVHASGGVDVHDYSTGQWDVREARRGGRRPWRGSGGRWRVWIGRFLLWACIIVLLVNGVRAEFERFTAEPSQTPSAPRQDAKAAFPVTGAQAYAVQFAGVYLNYDQKDPVARERALQFFLPDGVDGQFGWNGTGDMRVQSVQSAGADVRDANNAVVMVLAQANGRWLQLAVPVYAKDGRFVVSGEPALLPPPQRAQPPQQAGTIERDTGLENELQQTLVGFFKAYGSGDTVNLTRFSDDESVTGLGGAVTFGQLKEVNAPNGAADQRDITATVAWQIPSSQPRGASGELEQTYQLTVVKKDGTWYVRDIRGSTQRTGS
ncbi:MAG TPA: conjugal transfer protein [Streptosporangiaceae bacterium]|nr:conjugal transfer protein [Streptosporangiaceae bacterium]